MIVRTRKTKARCHSTAQLLSALHGALLHCSDENRHFITWLVFDHYRFIKWNEVLGKEFSQALYSAHKVWNFNLKVLHKKIREKNTWFSCCHNWMGNRITLQFIHNQFPFLFFLIISCTGVGKKGSRMLSQWNYSYVHRTID